MLPTLAPPDASCVDTTRPRPDLVAAQAAWSALAPAVAGRAHMRVSRDGGRSYPERCQQRLSDRLPNQPAAVLTFAADGTTKCVAFDLDVKRGDVAADAARLASVLTEAGGRFFTDQSPGGGRHLYLLLADPVPAHEVRQLVLAIGAAVPSLDPQPMLSPVSGCIRPPGARHRSGGHQQLRTPLDDALAAAAAPSPPQTWQKLLQRFPAAPTPNRSWTDPVDGDADIPAGHETLPGLPGHTAPSPAYLHIARTGDPTGYASPSEARQAVVWAAAAAGWPLLEVQRRMETGLWPGLAALYLRYRSPRKALLADWQRATAFEKSRREQHRSSQVRQCNTREHKTHAAVLKAQQGHQQVRGWASVAAELERTRWSGDPSRILVVRACGRAAQLTGQMGFEVGDRALALACHLDVATVSRHLQALRDEPDPVLARVVDHQGIRADVYELLIPPGMAQLAERTSWRPGPLHALRPVFRVLGAPAGFAYEALTRARGPLSVFQVQQLIPYAHTAVRDALDTLAGWDLARRTPTGWVIGPASPDVVAEHVGADIIHRAVVERYRHERAEYRAHVWGIPYIGNRTTATPQRPPPQSGDPGVADAVRLLTTILGAEPIVEHEQRVA